MCKNLACFRWDQIELLTVTKHYATFIFQVSCKKAFSLLQLAVSD